ncbi:HNH endonuclease [Candidatus Nitrosoglobus terrae]|uniref:HNH endonuclease n=1 Tax=Candidatus Nitrosoglobus terrae TaxID=1630141 RepID=UPI0018D4F000|nr:HNH endonuclease [Candidatus Nitrosoglobus terrae]
MLPALQREFAQDTAEHFMCDDEAIRIGFCAALRLTLRRCVCRMKSDTLQGIAVERWVSQRVGQDKFCEAMLEYWGGACAVTGVNIPEVLRANHAKPWAECVTDAERLDVFNGLLLMANLDALFDRFLISFDEQGRMLIAPALAEVDLFPLGIMPGMELRWIEPQHQPYLAQHRHRLRVNKNQVTPLSQ